MTNKRTMCISKLPEDELNKIVKASKIEKRSISGFMNYHSLQVAEAVIVASNERK